MKQSNKLLLLFVAVAVTLFVSAQLALYQKYKKDPTAIRHAHSTEEFLRRYMPPPVYLSLKGFSNVTVIPSDSFYLEYANPEVDTYTSAMIRQGVRKDSLPFHFYQLGDTLMLSGFDTLAPEKPNQREVTLFTPFVRIHCRDIRLIRQEAGALFLIGGSQQNNTPSAHLLLQNVQLCSVGDRSEQRRYNQLSIDAVNSMITLDARADIRQLDLQLDSSSVVTLSGANLKKLRGQAKPNF